MKTNAKINALLNAPWLPGPLKPALRDLARENAPYAADEVVAAGEELLEFISALSILAYMYRGRPDDAFDQYLLELLTGLKHGNAIVHCREACRMLATVDGIALASKILERHGEFVRPAVALEGLAARRNHLMHGIFIAPASQNIEDAEKLCDLLTELFADGSGQILGTGADAKWNGIPVGLLFEESRDSEMVLSPDWHVLRGPDTYIRTASLPENSSFRALLAQSRAEMSGDFLAEEEKAALDPAPHDEAVVARIMQSLQKSAKGAIHVQGGLGTGKTALWGATVRAVRAAGYHTIAYRLKTRGLSYTASVLLGLIAQQIEGITGEKRSKKVLDFIQKAAKHPKGSDKICVVLDDAHLRMFSSAHFLTLSNELYDAGIRIIAFAPAYPWLRSRFNEEITIPKPPRSAEPADIESFVAQYLRDKGPDARQSVDERAQHHDIVATVEYLRSKLEKGEKLHLRRLASEQENFTLAMLEEAAAILTPIVKHGSEPFEKDTVHDVVTDVAIQKTEMTAPYIILRRRDIAMEWEAPTIIRDGVAG